MNKLILPISFLLLITQLSYGDKPSEIERNSKYLYGTLLAVTISPDEYERLDLYKSLVKFEKRFYSVSPNFPPYTPLSEVKNRGKNLYRFEDITPEILKKNTIKYPSNSELLSGFDFLLLISQQTDFKIELSNDEFVVFKKRKNGVR